MDNIIKCLKNALMFPIIITMFVMIVVFSYLSESNYKFTYQDKLVSSNFKYEILEEGFLWPTPGYTNISSYFGKRNSPTAGASSNHKGIDILAYQGSNICAIESGVIVFAGWDKSGGYMVKIKHENDLFSSYCHMSEDIKVMAGESVNKGDIIGTVGPKYLPNGKLNGATTGVHLHFGVSKNGVYINPLSLFFKKKVYIIIDERQEYEGSVSNL